MWGFAPMYFKLLHEVPAAEILMHRVVWSVAILFIVIVMTKQIKQVTTAIRNAKVMKILFISGLLLACNWYLFIWAVNNDHLLDASLGYYINPLLNVFLGRMFLGERLRVLQQVAVGVAALGVAILIFSFGQVPWISLALACSFGIYGLLRKKVAVGSFAGLLVESTMMLPIAIYYWAIFAVGSGDMLNNTVSLNILLISAGIVTTAPLLCFTSAAKRLQYSTLGFFQYLGPSIMFILAVSIYNEPLDLEMMVTFGFIWSALAIFSFDSLLNYRKSKMKLATT
jgi:chloramphenicol-sensitive protein RarD